MTPLETEMLMAMEDLIKELRSHVKMDVRKHFSLMVAEACAQKVIWKAKGEPTCCS